MAAPLTPAEQEELDLRLRIDWWHRFKRGERPPTIPGLGTLTPLEAEEYFASRMFLPEEDVIARLRQMRAASASTSAAPAAAPDAPAPSSASPPTRVEPPSSVLTFLDRIVSPVAEALTSREFQESPPVKILKAPFVAAEYLVKGLGLPETTKALSVPFPRVEVLPPGVQGPPRLVTPEQPEVPTAELIGTLLGGVVPFGGFGVGKSLRSTPTPPIEPVTPAGAQPRLGPVLLRKELPVLPPDAVIVEPPKLLEPAPTIPGAPSVHVPDEVAEAVQARQGPRPAQFTETQRIDHILAQAGVTRDQLRTAIRTIKRGRGDTAEARELLEAVRDQLPGRSTGSLAVFLERFQALDRPTARTLPTQAELAQAPVFPPDQSLAVPTDTLRSTTETVFASQVGLPRPLPSQPAEREFIGPQILRIEREAAQAAQDRARGILPKPTTPPKNPYHLEPKTHAELMKGYRDWPTVPLVTKAGVQDVPVPPQLLREIQASTKELSGGDPIVQALDPAAASFTVRDLRIHPDTGTPIAPFRRPQAGPRDLGTATLHPDGTLEILPPAYERFFEATFDVLDRTGPIGVQLSNLFRHLYHTVRQQTVRDTDALHRRFQAIFGLRPGLRGALIRENPFTFASMPKLYNVTEAEVRDLFDYLYVGMDTARWQALDPARRGKPVPPKIVEAARAYFEGDGQTFGGTRGPSSHPGIQGNRVDPSLNLEPDTIATPFGERPVGEPTPFMPQQPVNPNLKEIFKPETLQRLYESEQRRHPDPALTLDLFRRRLREYFSTQPIVQARRYAGINHARTLDLTLNDTASAYDTAKRLGYETDPFRAFFRFAHGTYFRGESRLIEQQANELAGRLVAQLDEQRPGSGNWVRIMAERVMGLTTNELLDRTVHDWITRIRAFNDLTILGPVSTISSFNQIVPIIARGGFFNFLRGVGNQIANRALDPGDLGVRSGAIFANLFNDFYVPSGRLARWASRELNAQGFSGVDKYTRLVAAQVGSIDLQKTIRKLLQDPANPTLRGLIREFDLNPTEVLQKATLDPREPFGVRVAEEILTRGVQAFAEKAAGGTTPSQLSLWRLNHADHARLILQYRQYAGSNGAELVRYAKQSPSTRIALARIARGLFAGALAGEVTNDLINLITFREDPFGLHPRSKTLEQTFGPVAGKLIEDLALGLGTVQFAIALTLLEATEEAVLSSVVGANVTEAAKAIHNVGKAIAGDPTALAEQIIRRVPVAGATLHGLAQQILEPPRHGGLQPLAPFGHEP